MPYPTVSLNQQDTALNNAFSFTQTDPNWVTGVPAVGSVVYRPEGSAYWDLASALSPSTQGTHIVTAKSGTTYTVVDSGVWDYSASGLTPTIGARLYVSETAGQFTEIAPNDYARQLGIVLDNTKILIQRDDVVNKHDGNWTVTGDVIADTFGTTTATDVTLQRGGAPIVELNAAEANIPDGVTLTTDKFTFRGDASTPVAGYVLRSTDTSGTAVWAPASTTLSMTATTNVNAGDAVKLTAGVMNAVSVVTSATDRIAGWATSTVTATNPVEVTLNGILLGGQTFTAPAQIGAERYSDKDTGALSATATDGHFAGVVFSATQLLALNNSGALRSNLDTTTPNALVRFTSTDGQTTTDSAVTLAGAGNNEMTGLIQVNTGAATDLTLQRNSTTGASLTDNAGTLELNTPDAVRTSTNNLRMRNSVTQGYVLRASNADGDAVWAPASTTVRMTNKNGGGSPAGDVALGTAVKSNGTANEFVEITSASDPILGFTTAAIVDQAQGEVTLNGTLMGGFTGLTVGDKYYVDPTNGTLSAANIDNGHFVGVAFSDTQLLIISPTGAARTTNTTVTDTQIPVYDGNSGENIKSTTVTIDGSANVAGALSLAGTGAATLTVNSASANDLVMQRNSVTGASLTDNAGTLELNTPDAVRTSTNNLRMRNTVTQGYVLRASNTDGDAVWAPASTTVVMANPTASVIPAMTAVKLTGAGEVEPIANATDIIAGVTIASLDVVANAPANTGEVTLNGTIVGGFTFLAGDVGNKVYVDTDGAGIASVDDAADTGHLLGVVYSTTEILMVPVAGGMRTTDVVVVPTRVPVYSDDTGENLQQSALAVDGSANVTGAANITVNASGKLNADIINTSANVPLSFERNSVERMALTDTALTTTGTVNVSANLLQQRANPTQGYVLRDSDGSGNAVWALPSTTLVMTNANAGTTPVGDVVRGTALKSNGINGEFVEVTSATDIIIGYAAEDIANGSTGEVTINGTLMDGYDSLTPNTKYYMDYTDGSISTTDNGHLVAVAFTDTQMLFIPRTGGMRSTNATVTPTQIPVYSDASGDNVQTTTVTIDSSANVAGALSVSGTGSAALTVDSASTNDLVLQRNTVTGATLSDNAGTLELNTPDAVRASINNLRLRNAPTQGYVMRSSNANGDAVWAPASTTVLMTNKNGGGGDVVRGTALKSNGTANEFVEIAAATDVIIGFAAADIADQAQGEVTLNGTLVGGFLGLTVGAKYYADYTNGTVTSTDTGHFVGVAFSGNEILITPTVGGLRSTNATAASPAVNHSLPVYSGTDGEHVEKTNVVIDPSTDNVTGAANITVNASGKLNADVLNTSANVPLSFERNSVERMALTDTALTTTGTVNISANLLQQRANPTQGYVLRDSDGSGNAVWAPASTTIKMTNNTGATISANRAVKLVADTANEIQLISSPTDTIAGIVLADIIDGAEGEVTLNGTLVGGFSFAVGDIGEKVYMNTTTGAITTGADTGHLIGTVFSTTHVLVAPVVGAIRANSAAVTINALSVFTDATGEHVTSTGVTIDIGDNITNAASLTIDAGGKMNADILNTSSATDLNIERNGTHILTVNANGLTTESSYDMSTNRLQQRLDASTTAGYFLRNSDAAGTALWSLPTLVLTMTNNTTVLIPAKTAVKIQSDGSVAPITSPSDVIAGITTSQFAAPAASTGTVAFNGFVIDGFSTLTPGTKMYADMTTGLISNTAAGGNLIGVAFNANQVLAISSAGAGSSMAIMDNQSGGAIAANVGVRLTGTLNQIEPVTSASHLLIGYTNESIANNDTGLVSLRGNLIDVAGGTIGDPVYLNVTDGTLSSTDNGHLVGVVFSATQYLMFNSASSGVTTTNATVNTTQIPVYDGATGHFIKTTGVTISDTNYDMTGMRNITASGAIAANNYADNARQMIYWAEQAPSASPNATIAQGTPLMIAYDSPNVRVTRAGEYPTQYGEISDTTAFTGAVGDTSATTYSFPVVMMEADYAIWAKRDASDSDKISAGVIKLSTGALTGTTNLSDGTALNAAPTAKNSDLVLVKLDATHVLLIAADGTNNAEMIVLQRNVGASTFTALHTTPQNLAARTITFTAGLENLTAITLDPNNVFVMYRNGTDYRGITVGVDASYNIAVESSPSSNVIVNHGDLAAQHFVNMVLLSSVSVDPAIVGITYNDATDTHYGVLKVDKVNGTITNNLSTSTLPGLTPVNNNGLINISPCGCQVAVSVRYSINDLIITAGIASTGQFAWDTTNQLTHTITNTPLRDPAINVSLLFTERYRYTVLFADDGVASAGGMEMISGRIIGTKVYSPVESDGFAGTLVSATETTLAPSPPVFNVSVTANVGNLLRAVLPDDFEIYATAAGNAYLAEGQIIGFAGESVVATESLSTTNKVILNGPVISGYSGLIPGTLYYLDLSNPGTPTTSSASNTVIGVALSDTEVVSADRSSLSGVPNIVQPITVQIDASLDQLNVATINEKVADAGVTIEGSLHKDNEITVNTLHYTTLDPPVQTTNESLTTAAGVTLSKGDAFSIDGSGNMIALTTGGILAGYCAQTSIPPSTSGLVSLAGKLISDFTGLTPIGSKQYIDANGVLTGIYAAGLKFVGIALSGSTLLLLNNASVDGPSASTNNALTRFDGTDGLNVKNSTVTLTDTNVMTGVRTITGETGQDLTLNGVAGQDVVIESLQALSANVATGSTQTFKVNNVTELTVAAGNITAATKITTPALQVSTNAALNQYLRSDASGNATWDQITDHIRFTATGGITEGNPVYLLSNGTVSVATSSAHTIIGYAETTVTTGNPVDVAISGRLAGGFGTLITAATSNVGDIWYINPNSGLVTTTASGNDLLGVQYSATELLLIGSSGGVKTSDTTVIDQRLVRYDGSTGKLINQSIAVTLDDNNVLTGVRTITGEASQDLTINAPTGQDLTLTVPGGQAVNVTGNTIVTGDVTLSGDLDTTAGDMVLKRATTTKVTVGTADTTFVDQVVAPTVKLTTAPSLGYVLTSDAAGVGSWQPAGTILQLTNSTATPIAEGKAVKFINSTGLKVAEIASASDIVAGYVGDGGIPASAPGPVVLAGVIVNGYIGLTIGDTQYLDKSTGIPTTTSTGNILYGVATAADSILVLSRSGAMHVDAATVTPTAVPKFSTTSVDKLVESGVLIDASNNVTGVVDLTTSGTTTTSTLTSASATNLLLQYDTTTKITVGTSDVTFADTIIATALQNAAAMTVGTTADTNLTLERNNVNVLEFNTNNAVFSQPILATAVQNAAAMTIGTTAGTDLTLERNTTSVLAFDGTDATFAQNIVAPTATLTTGAGTAGHIIKSSNTSGLTAWDSIDNVLLYSEDRYAGPTDADTVEALSATPGVPLQFVQADSGGLQRKVQKLRAEFAHADFDESPQLATADGVAADYEHDVAFFSGTSSDYFVSVRKEGTNLRVDLHSIINGIIQPRHDTDITLTLNANDTFKLATLSDTKMILAYTNIGATNDVVTTHVITLVKATPEITIGAASTSALDDHIAGDEVLADLDVVKASATSFLLYYTFVSGTSIVGPPLATVTHTVGIIGVVSNTDVITYPGSSTNLSAALATTPSVKFLTDNSLIYAARLADGSITTAVVSTNSVTGVITMGTPNDTIVAAAAGNTMVPRNAIAVLRSNKFLVCWNDVTQNSARIGTVVGNTITYNATTGAFFFASAATASAGTVVDIDSTHVLIIYGEGSGTTYWTTFEVELSGDSRVNAVNAATAFATSWEAKTRIVHNDRQQFVALYADDTTPANTAYTALFYHLGVYVGVSASDGTADPLLARLNGRVITLGTANIIGRKYYFDNATMVITDEPSDTFVGVGYSATQILLQTGSTTTSSSSSVVVNEGNTNFSSTSTTTFQEGSTTVIQEGAVTTYEDNSVINVGGNTTYSETSEVTNVSGSTTTFNDGSIVNNESTENYGGGYTATYASSSQTTYAAGAIITNLSTENYQNGYVGTFENGAVNNYESGATTTFEAGSTTNLDGTTNISGTTTVETGATTTHQTGTTTTFQNGSNLTLDASANFTISKNAATDYVLRSTNGTGDAQWDSIDTVMHYDETRKEALTARDPVQYVDVSGARQVQKLRTKFTSDDAAEATTFVATTTTGTKNINAEKLSVAFFPNTDYFISVYKMTNVTKVELGKCVNGVVSVVAGQDKTVTGAGVSINVAKIVMLSATKAVVIYASTSSLDAPINATVIDFDISTPSITLTDDVDNAFAGFTSWTYGDVLATKVSSSSFMVVYGLSAVTGVPVGSTATASTIGAVLATVSGTNVTWGNHNTVYSNTFSYMDVKYVSDNLAVLGGTDGSSRALTLTTANGLVTGGTAVVAGTGATGILDGMVAVLNSSTFVLSWHNTTTQDARVGVISTTGITFGAAAFTVATVTSTGRIIAISESTVLCAYQMNTALAASFTEVTIDLSTAGAETGSVTATKTATFTDQWISTTNWVQNSRQQILFMYDKFGAANELYYNALFYSLGIHIGHADGDAGGGLESIRTRGRVLTGYTSVIIGRAYYADLDNTANITDIANDYFLGVGYSATSLLLMDSVPNAGTGASGSSLTVVSGGGVTVQGVTINEGGISLSTIQEAAPGAGVTFTSTTNITGDVNLASNTTTTNAGTTEYTTGATTTYQAGSTTNLGGTTNISGTTNVTGDTNITAGTTTYSDNIAINTEATTTYGAGAENVYEASSTTTFNAGSNLVINGNVTDGITIESFTSGGVSANDAVYMDPTDSKVKPKTLISQRLIGYAVATIGDGSPVDVILVGKTVKGLTGVTVGAIYSFNEVTGAWAVSTSARTAQAIGINATSLMIIPRNDLSNEVPANTAIYALNQPLQFTTIDDVNRLVEPLAVCCTQGVGKTVVNVASAANTGGANSQKVSSAFFPTTDHFVSTYINSGNLYADLNQMPGSVISNIAAENKTIAASTATHARVANLSSTQAVVLYSDTVTTPADIYARVLDYDPTASTGNKLVVAAASADAVGTDVTAARTWNQIECTKVTSTTFLATYHVLSSTGGFAANSLIGVVGTLTGSTIAWGSGVNLVGAAITAGYSVAYLSDGIVAIAYKLSSDDSMRTLVLSITGSSIVPGTPSAAIETNANIIAPEFSAIAVHSATKYTVGYAITGGNNRAAIFDVTGSTVSVSVVAFDTDTGNGSNRTILATIDADEFLVMRNITSGTTEWAVMKISDTATLPTYTAFTTNMDTNASFTRNDNNRLVATYYTRSVFTSVVYGGVFFDLGTYIGLAAEVGTVSSDPRAVRLNGTVTGGYGSTVIDGYTGVIIGRKYFFSDADPTVITKDATSATYLGVGYSPSEILVQVSAGGGSGGGGGGSGSVSTTDATVADNRLVRYDGTTGDSIQQSGIEVGDDDSLSGVLSVTNAAGSALTIGTSDAQDVIIQRNGTTEITVGASTVTLADSLTTNTVTSKTTTDLTLQYDGTTKLTLGASTATFADSITTDDITSKAGTDLGLAYAGTEKITVGASTVTLADSLTTNTVTSKTTTDLILQRDGVTELTLGDGLVTVANDITAANITPATTTLKYWAEYAGITDSIPQGTPLMLVTNGPTNVQVTTVGVYPSSIGAVSLAELETATYASEAANPNLTFDFVVDDVFVWVTRDDADSDLIKGGVGTLDGSGLIAYSSPITISDGTFMSADTTKLKSDVAIAAISTTRCLIIAGHSTNAAQIGLLDYTGTVAPNATVANTYANVVNVTHLNLIKLNASYAFATYVDTNNLKFLLVNISGDTVSVLNDTAANTVLLAAAHVAGTWNMSLLGISADAATLAYFHEPTAGNYEWGILTINLNTATIALSNNDSAAGRNVLGNNNSLLTVSTSTLLRCTTNTTSNDIVLTAGSVSSTNVITWDTANQQTITTTDLNAVNTSISSSGDGRYTVWFYDDTDATLNFKTGVITGTKLTVPFENGSVATAAAHVSSPDYSSVKYRNTKFVRAVYPGTFTSFATAAASGYTSSGIQIGYAKESVTATSGSGTPLNYVSLIGPIISGYTGLTPGSRYYLDFNNPTVPTSSNASQVQIGVALSQTTLINTTGGSGNVSVDTINPNTVGGNVTINADTIIDGNLTVDTLNYTTLQPAVNSLQVTLTNASGATIPSGTGVYIVNTNNAPTIKAMTTGQLQAGYTAASISDGLSGPVTLNGTISTGYLSIVPGTWYYLDKSTGAVSTGNTGEFIGVGYTTTSILMMLDVGPRGIAIPAGTAQFKYFANSTITYNIGDPLKLVQSTTDASDVRVMKIGSAPTPPSGTGFTNVTDTETVSSNYLIRTDGITPGTTYSIFATLDDTHLVVGYELYSDTTPANNGLWLHVATINNTTGAITVDPSRIDIKSDMVGYGASGALQFNIHKFSSTKIVAVGGLYNGDLRALTISWDGNVTLTSDTNSVVIMTYAERSNSNFTEPRISQMSSDTFVVKVKTQAPTSTWMLTVVRFDDPGFTVSPTKLNSGVASTINFEIQGVSSTQFVYGNATMSKYGVGQVTNTTTLAFGLNDNTGDFTGTQQVGEASSNTSFTLINTDFTSGPLFALGYKSSQSTNSYIRIGYVNGTDIVWGNEFSTGNGSSGAGHVVTATTTSVLLYRQTGSVTNVIEYTVNGINDPIEVYNTNINYTNPISNHDLFVVGKFLVGMYNGGGNQRFVIAHSGSSVTATGGSGYQDVGGLFIGVAGETAQASLAETVTRSVIPRGALITGLTGPLDVGSRYYYQTNGTISTTVSANEAGIAYSTTAIISAFGANTGNSSGSGSSGGSGNGGSASKTFAFFSNDENNTTSIPKGTPMQLIKDTATGLVIRASKYGTTPDPGVGAFQINALSTADYPNYAGSVSQRSKFTFFDDTYAVSVIKNTGTFQPQWVTVTMAGGVPTYGTAADISTSYIHITEGTGDYNFHVFGLSSTRAIILASQTASDSTDIASFEFDGLGTITPRGGASGTGRRLDWHGGSTTETTGMLIGCRLTDTTFVTAETGAKMRFGTINPTTHDITGGTISADINFSVDSCFLARFDDTSFIIVNNTNVYVATVSLGPPAVITVGSAQNPTGLVNVPYFDIKVMNASNLTIALMHSVNTTSLRVTIGTVNTTTRTIVWDNTNHLNITPNGTGTLDSVAAAMFGSLAQDTWFAVYYDNTDIMHVIEGAVAGTTPSIVKHDVSAVDSTFRAPGPNVIWSSGISASPSGAYVLLQSQTNKKLFALEGTNGGSGFELFSFPSELIGYSTQDATNTGYTSTTQYGVTLRGALLEDLGTFDIDNVAAQALVPGTNYYYAADGDLSVSDQSKGRFGFAITTTSVITDIAGGGGGNVTDNIYESTPDAGVNIDGVLCKDGRIYALNAGSGGNVSSFKYFANSNTTIPAGTFVEFVYDDATGADVRVATLGLLPTLPAGGGGDFSSTANISNAVSVSSNDMDADSHPSCDFFSATLGITLSTRASNGAVEAKLLSISTAATPVIASLDTIASLTHIVTSGADPNNSTIDVVALSSTTSIACSSNGTAAYLIAITNNGSTLTEFAATKSATLGSGILGMRLLKISTSHVLAVYNDGTNKYYSVWRYVDNSTAISVVSSVLNRAVTADIINRQVDLGIINTNHALVVWNSSGAQIQFDVLQYDTTNPASVTLTRKTNGTNTLPSGRDTETHNRNVLAIMGDDKFVIGYTAPAVPGTKILQGVTINSTDINPTTTLVGATATYAGDSTSDTKLVATAGEKAVVFYNSGNTGFMRHVAFNGLSLVTVSSAITTSGGSLMSHSLLAQNAFVRKFESMVMYIGDGGATDEVLVIRGDIVNGVGGSGFSTNYLYAGVTKQAGTADLSSNTGLAAYEVALRGFNTEIPEGSPSLAGLSGTKMVAGTLYYLNTTNGQLTDVSSGNTLVGQATGPYSIAMFN